MTHHMLQLNQLTEVISVEGAASFVVAFITHYKAAFDTNKVWQVNFKNSTETASAEVTLGNCFNSTKKVLSDILNSVNVLLADNTISLNDTNIVICYQQYTLTITPNIVEAIRQQAEITYIVKGKLAKKLSPKNIIRAENIIEYFHDTCCTYYDHQSLTTDRYYFTSVQQPLPIKEIVQLCTGVHFILEQFNQVTELNCTLKATGVTRNQ